MEMMDYLDSKLTLIKEKYSLLSRQNKNYKDVFFMCLLIGQKSVFYTCLLIRRKHVPFIHMCFEYVKYIFE